MYVNTENEKYLCFVVYTKADVGSLFLRNIIYRAICMEWRIYSGFKEKTGKRYERYYAG